MPIKLRLFHSPRTIEQFVDKAGAKAYHEGVGIVLAEYDNKFLYLCQGVLKTSNAELLLPVHYGFKSDTRSINKAVKDTLVDMISNAQRLGGFGLPIKVDGIIEVLDKASKKRKLGQAWLS